MERERIEAIRAMVDLQAKRHAELGGPESSYQVAINPSDLAYLLDSERARRVGEAVIEAVRKHDEQHRGFGIDAIADDIGSDERYMPHVEGAKILRAAAAALRGEP